MSKLILLEGPDGAGKTTLLDNLVDTMPDKTKFYHFNRQSGLRKTVARMYQEAMMPAVLGAYDVVMDRSWLSEVPYAKAFWANDDRLGPLQIRMLERIAMRCETVVIRCDPGWALVEKSFQNRREDEMLKDTAQLKQVYDWYKTMETSLPCLVYDYTKHGPNPLMPGSLFTTRAHNPDLHTAGNLDAKTLVVGDPSPDLTDADHFMRLPFCSFSGAGSSKWVTQQFENGGIGEERLFWCNSDHLDDVFKSGWQGGNVLALGHIAASACREFGFSPKLMPHPDKWRKDFPEQAYPVEAA